MRKWSIACACVLALGWPHAVSGERPADIAGRWEVTTRTPDRVLTEQWTIQQKGATITATAKGAHGETPVSGTIYYRIHDGKVYFEKFKDVYSEGKLSKFYLAEDSAESFMDFHGNLNLQVRMKQYNLVFKLAELFTVSVQGNIKKPTYSLNKQPH